MQRVHELVLGDWLLELIERGPTPAEGPPTTVDPHVYIDVDRHVAEVEVMRRLPTAVVASSEVAEAGDFVTTNILGVPILVARGQDGELHASVNVCAHRGSTVETRTSGNARILSCGFHGWSYDLNGSLRAVSDAPLFSNESCETGLVRLHCEERHGIAWVVVDPGSPIDVGEWIGDHLEGLFRELGLDEMVHFASQEFDLACNWKLLTDGFLELYHLKYLHRNSIAPYFPANLTMQARQAGHFVNWLPKNRLVKQLTTLPREEWQVIDNATAAVVLVPGTVVQWQAGHVELFSLRPHPTDPSRTVARLTMMVPSDRADESDLWQRNWERVCDTIPAEDFAAAVDVQRNVDAGVVSELQIGANEVMLVEHLEAIDAMIDVPALGQD